MHPPLLFRLLILPFVSSVACSSGGSSLRNPAVRPEQAPLVGVRDVLEQDDLLGKRVRVVGRCTAAEEGRRAGFWTLTEAGAVIEVRGRLPASCRPGKPQDLTIFAQVERKAAGGEDRLLLRLPD